MPLAPGTRLGPYEVLSPLGAGGMGEVYRAHDTRLGRDVAIKVSGERFSERFEREARAIAALNHPHICALYDVGPDYLVMELVEGPTLAARIETEPIPMQDALVIARQIAEALEAAHEKGIVHRDLKPGNIMLTAEGNVKVLDFGLAKALETDSAAGNPRSSPTLTLSATRAGVILGTAAYMSPEQARGAVVDKRADIWAFGVVLYEMLTGRRLFENDTVSDTLASVLKSDPDWNSLPPDTPLPIRKLLRRCLERDLRKRLRDAGDARLEIEEALAGGEQAGAGLLAQPARSQAKWQQRLPWLLASVSLLAAGVALWGWLHTPASLPRPVMRWTTTLPNTRGGRPGVTLSPDGSHLAYVGTTSSGAAMIHVRAMDQFDAKPISSTSGSFSAGHFFSPDGRWIGYSTAGKVRKAPVSGGTSITICEGTTVFGAEWGLDDTIIRLYSRIRG